MDDERKRDSGRLADQEVLNLHAAMNTIQYNRREHVIVTNAASGYMPLRMVSERHLYYELLHPQYRLHHSTLKWQEYFGFLDWSKIWAGVHNPLANETTSSVIWEHLHLNFPTTYTMNRMRKRSDPCPFCGVFLSMSSILFFHAPLLHASGLTSLFFTPRSSGPVYRI